MIDFCGVKSIHFVGVGGVSMSKLCGYFIVQGYNCSGSDISNSRALASLRQLGANVYVGENSAISRNADIVVYTSAIPLTHIELTTAKRAYERKELLAYLESLFKRSICISGAHGKTTVSAMLAWVCDVADIDTLSHVGGETLGLDSFYIPRDNDNIIIEACEYKRSFLCLRPTYGVILNIDYDHPDCYAGIDDTYRAFAEFAARTTDALILEYAVSQRIINLASGMGNMENLRIITFGESHDADYYYTNALKVENGYSCDIYKYGEYYGNFIIHTINKINLKCLIATIAISDNIGVTKVALRKAISSFKGVERRLEFLGIAKSGASVYTDYAHHPSELNVLIENIRETLNGRIAIVFQPHTYSRTKALLSEFADALADCERLYVLPTYSAREIESQGVNAKALTEAINDRGGNAVYIDNYSLLIGGLEDLGDSDYIFLVGAGIEYREIFELLAN